MVFAATAVFGHSGMLELVCQHCCQKDVSELVGSQTFEVWLGEVDFEVAPELYDAFLDLRPVEGEY